MKFDIITSFEFFEHPHPDEISGILKNMNKHLRMRGVTLGTINLSPGDHHRCAQSVQEWDKIFWEHGFERVKNNGSQWTSLQEVAIYPFRTTARTNAPHIFGGLVPFQDVSYYTETEMLLDSELSTKDRENYAYFFTKTRECE